MKEIAREIIKYSWFILFVPFISGLFNFKRSSVANRVLIVHIGIATAITLVSAILWHLRKNNLSLLHVYTVLEFTMLSAYYALIFGKKNGTKIIAVIAVLFIILAGIDSFFIQSIFQRNSYIRSLEALLILIYAGFGYYNLIRRKAEESLTSYSFFWINTGYFIYFAASFYMFLLSNYLSTWKADIRYVAWAAHAIVMAIMYIFVSIGLWKRR